MIASSCLFRMDLNKTFNNRFGAIYMVIIENTVNFVSRRRVNFKRGLGLTAYYPNTQYTEEGFEMNETF